MSASGFYLVQSNGTATSRREVRCYSLNQLKREIDNDQAQASPHRGTSVRGNHVAGAGATGGARTGSGSVLPKPRCRVARLPGRECVCLRPKFRSVGGQAPCAPFVAALIW